MGFFLEYLIFGGIWKANSCGWYIQILFSEIKNVWTAPQTLKARARGATFIATFRATVAEAESRSTFATLGATNCIVWQPRNLHLVARNVARKVAPCVQASKACQQALGLGLGLFCEGRGRKKSLECIVLNNFVSARSVLLDTSC